MYDHLLYPGVGTTLLTFFAFPIGQGVATALGAAVGSNKTQADKNSTLAG